MEFAPYGSKTKNVSWYCNVLDEQPWVNLNYAPLLKHCLISASSTDEDIVGSMVVDFEAACT